ncbi:MAG: caspase family protein [Acidobacteriota bacterium]
MPLRRIELRALAFFVILALSTASIQGQNAAADLYRAGLRSFDFGYWREALVFFAAAAQVEPRAGQNVREYGMWQAPYLPYYHQGLALYELGHYEAALKAFEASEAAGAITARRSKKYLKRLVATRTQIRREIGEQVQQLYRSATADYETAEELQQSRALADPEHSSALPSFSAITASLEKTTASLQDASLQTAAAELNKALGLLDQARDGIAEMAQEIRRRELEEIAERNRLEAERRAQQRRADRELAAALLASGGCRPDAIELLERQLPGLPQPSESHATGKTLPSLLAQAHLQCDQFGLAEHYVETSKRYQQSDWRTLHEQLRLHQQEARHRASYRDAAEQVETDRCDQRGLESLQDLVSQGWSPLEGALPLELLIEAHLDCGEPEQASVVLERASSSLAPRRVDELRQAIASSQKPELQGALNENLLGQYRSAIRRITAGACARSAIGLLQRLTGDHGSMTLAPSEMAAAHRALIRGSLQCADIDASRRALEAAEPHLASALERQRLEMQIEDHKLRQERRKLRELAIEDYLSARARTELEQCSDHEIAGLIERAERTLGSVVDGSGAQPFPRAASPRGEAGSPAAATALTRSAEPLPIAYQPHLVLARAYSRCRSRDRVERQLELARGSGEATAEDLADLQTWLDEHPRIEPYTGSFALLVAASDYSSGQGWATLYQPGEDIMEVRRVLEHHGFQVETLDNPTGRELETALDQFFTRYGDTPSHRLVFYYAGHGHTEVTRHGIKLGYLVPVDAGNPRQDRANLRDLLGMERFREYAIRSEANDILFMFDSCFAGTVFKATKSCALPQCAPPPLTGTSLTELVSRPVRMFLTAGDETERVPDDSLFRLMVTQALDGAADRNEDGFILGRELADFVQREVMRRQDEVSARYKTAALGPAPAEPKWGTLIEGNFGRGDLVFTVPIQDVSTRTDAPGASPKPLETLQTAELVYWQAARRADAPADYQRYLEKFPEGIYAPLAGWILEPRSSP